MAKQKLGDLQRLHINASDAFGNRLTTGGDRGVFSAAIEEPGSTALGCVVSDANDGTYNISYFPTRPGRHTLSVKCNNNHISNSPFSFGRANAFAPT